MKIKLLILFFSICLFSQMAFAQNQILHYKPQVVVLTGTIKIKAFPGAPNYESVEGGDDLETCPYLILDHLIDVVKSSHDEDRDAETERNLKVIQIIGGNNNWSAKYVGKHVHVTGILFHRDFAHQHTPVLIEAKHLTMAK